MKEKIVPIIVIVLVVVAIGAGIVVVRESPQKKEERAAKILQETIESVLQTDTRAGDVVARDVRITQQYNQFIRGTLFDEQDGVSKTFFAIEINNQWRIVDVVSGPVSCERFARLGFPSAFISDCVLSFSDAVTVAEIDAVFGDFVSEGLPVTVIGYAQSSIQTDAGTVVSLTSNGVTVSVVVPEDIVTAGDIVVVTIADLEKQKQNTATTTVGNTKSAPVYVASTVVTVYPEDKTLIPNPESIPTLPQESKASSSTPSISGEQSAPIIKIKAPKTAPPQSYFFNTYDLETSFEDIQIDGSF